MKKWKCFLTAIVIAAGSMLVGCQGFSSAKPIEAMYIPAGEDGHLMVGEGTGYANLTYTLELTSEEYGVGFRKGSDLAEELNKFFEQSYADGTMQQIAEKYGVQAALIEQ